MISIEEQFFIARLKIYLYNPSLIDRFDEYINSQDIPLFETNSFDDVVGFAKKHNICLEELKEWKQKKKRKQKISK